MEFITLLVVTFIFWAYGVYCGWKARENHARKISEKLLDKLSKDLEEEVSENIMHINIERHSGVFYVYNKDTDEFMGQGKTKQELEKVLAERFPGKKFACPKETLIELGFIHDTI